MTTEAPPPHTHTPHNPLPALPHNTHTASKPQLLLLQKIKTLKHGPALSGTRDMVLITGTVRLCTFCQRATVKDTKCHCTHNAFFSTTSQLAAKRGTWLSWQWLNFVSLVFSGVKRMFKKKEEKNKK